MNTESALICGGFDDPPGGPNCESDPSSAFEQTKANYVAQVYAAAIAEDLHANIWYHVFGWRNSALLNSDRSPRPAYQAFATARNALLDAKLTREINEYPQVKGFEYTRSLHRVWVLWSLDGNSHLVNLDTMPTEIYTALGNPVAPKQPTPGWLHPTVPGLASVNWFFSMLAKLVSVIERKSDRFLYFLVALLLILGSAYAVYLGNTLRFYPDECYYSDLAQNLVTTGMYTLDGKATDGFPPTGVSSLPGNSGFFRRKSRSFPHLELPRPGGRCLLRVQDPQGAIYPTRCQPRSALGNRLSTRFLYGGDAVSTDAGSCPISVDALFLHPSGDEKP